MTVRRTFASSVTALVGAAVLAPSSHNTQPWRFRTSDGAIDVFADRTRALPVNDPEDRELTISCGCALFNIRAAAAAADVGTTTSLLPGPDDADWLARISADPRAASSSEAELSRHIERRRTYRRKFYARAVERTIVERLMAAATAEGAWLRPIEDEPDREALAQLVAEGDAVQWSNPSWRRELAAWMHPGRQGDGLTIPGLSAPLTHFVVRTFDMGGGIGAKDRELAEASPVMAILGTERDGPLEWLAAGQALQRVLLTGCQYGLQASFLNQPVQVASLRPKLGDLVNRAVPQIVLRIGYPVGDVPATPRRPIEHVVESA
jgi:hypothetical protein